MKPITISKRKSAPNVSPLFNMICECMNPHPFEVVGDHCYEPAEVDPNDYIKVGESQDREYFKLKTN